MLHFSRRAAATSAALTAAVMKRHFGVNISAISTAIYSTAAAIFYSYVLPVIIGSFNNARPLKAVTSAAAVTQTTVTGKAVASTELCCYVFWLSLHNTYTVLSRPVSTLSKLTQHVSHSCHVHKHTSTAKLSAETAEPASRRERRPTLSTLTTVVCSNTAQCSALDDATVQGSQLELFDKDEQWHYTQLQAVCTRTKVGDNCV
eukprot:16426-Heterococcus_DN1.PRE.4